jgi:hypothetical protein
MGKEFSTINAQPTLGIQTTNIYWPVRVNQPNKPLFMFRLDFWDVGHTSSTRFDYIDKVNLYFYRYLKKIKFLNVGFSRFT